jgi:hypothetical protein
VLDMNPNPLRSARFFLPLVALAIAVCTSIVGPSDARAQAEAPPPAEAAPAEATTVVEAKAEEAPPRPMFRLGAEASVVIPVGDYANGADIALGGNVRFAFDIHPNVGLTFRGGYLHHLGTPDGTSLGFVPLMFGGEYRFFPEGSTPFVLAEIGVTIGFATINTGFGSASDSDSELGLAIGGGYRFGPIDVRAMLYAPDADDLVGFQIAVGGDFLSF